MIGIEKSNRSSKANESGARQSKAVQNLEASRSRIVGVTAVITVIVLAVYGVSILVGGGFRDFCESAIPYVLAGIAIAAYLSYCTQKEKFMNGK